MFHPCTSLILHCIDFRFGKEIKKYLEEKGLLGDIDMVSLAGAVKNIVEPKAASDAEFVLRQIEISKKLHRVKNVYLMNHTDCGAYGGRAAFTSSKEEREKHIADMKKAAEIINQKFSDLKIHLLLAHLEEAEHKNKIWFEEIK